MSRTVKVYLIVLALLLLVTVGSCSALVMTGADQSYPAIEALYWGLLVIPLTSMFTGAVIGTVIAAVLLGVLRIIRGRHVADPAKFLMWCIAIVTAFGLLGNYLDFFGLR